MAGPASTAFPKARLVTFIALPSRSDLSTPRGVRPIRPLENAACRSHESVRAPGTRTSPETSFSSWLI